MAYRPLVARAEAPSLIPVGRRRVLGVLDGEGVGQQLIQICVDMLALISELFHLEFEIRRGGAIGLDALRASGHELSGGVCDFCREIFKSGGAILAGPGGGRFVYDMRKHFQLYLKLSPLRSFAELDRHVRGDASDNIDGLIARENLGGLYQGTSRFDDKSRSVSHTFECREVDIAQVTDAAARIACARRGHLTVVAKQSGLPDLSRIWFECGRRSAQRYGVELRTMDIDFLVYQLVKHPEEFDVVAAPNCFGDILSDVGGVFSGGRGSTFGGSFSERGAAVYQTNHGAAHDLAGRNTANPVGQIFSLAMMLRETFGLPAAADALEAAVRRCWKDGLRTADVMSSGCRLASTSDFADAVTSRLSEMKIALVAS